MMPPCSNDLQHRTRVHSAPWTANSPRPAPSPRTPSSDRDEARATPARATHNVSLIRGARATHQGLVDPAVLTGLCRRTKKGPRRSARFDTQSSMGPATSVLARAVLALHPASHIPQASGSPRE
jgi:hypothetical protein